MSAQVNSYHLLSTYCAPGEAGCFTDESETSKYPHAEEITITFN